ncbi:MAG: hypothetical protein HY278_09460 [candidate division NC10 bacterium]|nr:hypothetical protein [candidate division NC10 bacterium]
MARYRKVNAIAAFVLVSALSQFIFPVAWAEEAQESVGTQFAYGAGSTLLTVVNVPLKAALCGTTAVMSGIAYLLTFGSKHVAKDASDTVKGVCTGPYIITPQRLRAEGE